MAGNGVPVNRLSTEKSPYLLQHADNPVEWYPWGDEAFERARTEDRPIFLSIGYSTCHWCHVMAEESFEDPEVARMLNDGFVSIKVDREERPDIDGTYMTVCQLLTGSGGWPLTILMTPRGRPFFAGTYLPRTSRYGRTGLLDLLSQVQEMWATQRAELEQGAERITAALGRPTTAAAGEPTVRLLEVGYRHLLAQFDPEYGGFGTAPKFPTPQQLTFLLRYWRRTAEPKALKMVETTLESLRRGGVYDQVGFGFHRYSTDQHWLVPHFEKMLYDQAGLALAYAEAFQATGREIYAETLREIFTYVGRELTAAEGGFYSAEDADSEGGEGRFYLWTTAEIDAALSAAEAGLARRLFGLEETGNFRAEVGGTTGLNIPYLPGPRPELAAKLGLSPAELAQHREEIRSHLLTARDRRQRPRRDDKILTDWNGFMIAALAKGARALGEESYAAAANRAAAFILSRLRDSDGRLWHRYRGGEAAVPGFLDDYAYLIWGLLELYETTFQPAHLAVAMELTSYQLRHFWDEAGAFYLTSDEVPEILVRRKELYDGAPPAGNSVAMANLLRLGRLTGRRDWEEKAREIGRAVAGPAAQAPAGYAQFLGAVDLALAPSREAVIVGSPGDPGTRNLTEALARRFDPELVVLLRPPGPEGKDVVRMAPFTDQYQSLDGRATAYICQDYACQRPTTDPAEMLGYLNG